MRALTLMTAAILSLPGVAVAQVNAEKTSIGYASVADAHTALRSRRDVTFTKQDGWTIATEPNNVIWSFTPSSHPAHPSVGRRQLYFEGGRYFIETRILCQAQKDACDTLHADYVLLDRRMNEAILATK